MRDLLLDLREREREDDRDDEWRLAFLRRLLPSSLLELRRRWDRLCRLELRLRLEPRCRERERERDESELELLELFETDRDFEFSFSSSSISPASFWCPFCSTISDVFSAPLSSRFASRPEPLALSSIELLLLLLVGLDSSVDSLSSELWRDGDECSLREPDRERSAGDCDFRLETIVANFCFFCGFA